MIDSFIVERGANEIQIGQGENSISRKGAKARRDADLIVFASSRLRVRQSYLAALRAGEEQA
jgi:hypothetical protein